MLIARAPFLIIGLGNPGKEYAQSRHNVGFMVLDRLAERYGVAFTRYEQKAFVVKVASEQGSLIFAKPQTYMNLSGQSVSALVRFYKVPLEQLLIVYDDIDLPFGTLRMRPGGSSGGHKGMQSIIDRLGTQDIPRLRIGVGRPRGSKAAANYVLDEFNGREKLDLPYILDRATQAVQDWIRFGLAEAMNRHNLNLLADEP
ncbi:MAG: Peptidyl-tRNA hydrolase [Anaerolineae bacterium]|jgi:PTH1 family peptidyl-tRNA hydrolase|nr:MAG: Peptidyl-tRNA hydrolase [Anaerolineae bacterium]